MTTISRSRLLGGTVAGLAAAATLLVTAGPASACSCLPRSVCERVAASDTVFVATPVSRTVAGGTATYTVTVTKVYKGTVAPVAFVRTPADSAACGENFTLRTPYVIFGHRTSRFSVTTNLCDGDAPRASFSAADIRQIIKCASGPHAAPAPAGPGTHACRRAKA
ncbi:hypothetical protein ACRYCC_23445 [Actinomadura scrupuli]|uniref:hypothetical protein n=1 Tax=Actinomadura scrupuli TaxID=559629 RepID=UPI003D953133